jgi:diphthine-ammonia ligase
MCRIIAVFNNDRSLEFVVKGLEVMKGGDNAGFWVCTEKDELYSRNVHELSRSIKTKKSGDHCIGFCSSKPTLLRTGLKPKFVADADLYNVHELKKEHSIGGRNSYDLLLRLVEKYNSFNFLETIEGAYALAYWNDDEVYIARDPVGLKPVWFTHANGFAFASEKKALEAMGFPHAIELEPRTLLHYKIVEDRLHFEKRDSFSVAPEIKGDQDSIKEKLLNILRESIEKMIPQDEHFGVLFSGGLDSTLIASLCKERGADFDCYTVAVEEPGMKEAEDLNYAKRIAADLGLTLKIRKIRLDELERYLTVVVPLVESTDVVTISVAVPLYVAGERAREDGVTTVLYGLGTEELFAGYERHKHIPRDNLNNECLSGLLGMYAKDLYRDGVVANSQGITFRAPFLATVLVKYALKIPPQFKLTDDTNKVILRAIAQDLGLEMIASRKKRAVQYGSNILRGIEKLAKKTGYRYKKEYLRSFYPSRDQKFGCLFSSGKDSAFALWLMMSAGYQVECLITVKSRNPESYMFHTPAVELVNLQADAIGLPVIMKETEGEKEEELEDLRDALRFAKTTYGLDGVITGALWSTYQKGRIERIATEENLSVFSPLWRINQETEMRLAVTNFEVIFTGIGAYGLDKGWLGRRITMTDVDHLVRLNRKVRLNVSGEGGEFESLVLDGPMFKKKLVIVERDIVEEDEHTARLMVKRAKLVDK